VDPLALGAALSLACGVLFVAVHVRQRLAYGRLAEERLRELRRPFDTGTDSLAPLPLRRPPTSVPVLTLLFASGTRGAEADEELALAGLNVRPGVFLLTQALAAAVGLMIGLLIGGPSFVGLVFAAVLGLVGWLLPRGYLAYKTVRRLERMDRQLVDLLNLLSSSVRAGFSVMQGLDSASSRVGPPIQVEVQRVLADVRLGQRMEDALRAWADRVPSANLRLMVTAMIVQRSAGGNLAEVLDNLAQTMRERVELKHQVNALVAYSRLTARVVAVYPLGIAVLLSALNPDVYARLWTESSGWILLGAALSMNTIAFLIMRKLSQVQY
jgi:tight adherence protein B